MAELIDKVSRHLEALLTFPSLVQLARLAIALLASWWFGHITRERMRSQMSAPQLGLGFEHRVREGAVILGPYLVALVIIAAVGGALHVLSAPRDILDRSITLCGLLLLIRFAVYVARVLWSDRTKGWGNAITFLVWALLALHLLGWIDPLVQALDSVGLKAGEKRFTLWTVLKLAFTVGFFILVAVYLARWIERRLMSMQGLAISMRIGIAKFSQAFLIGWSVLLGLNVAGLHLTTLNVLTGAIGVGLGFGLQTIVANFVSGFVLLMDRSIKPGDVISFTGTTGTSTEGFGWVQELRGRYVVVRDRDGIETLVPNQNLITNSVISWSHTDPKVRLKAAGARELSQRS